MCCLSLSSQLHIFTYSKKLYDNWIQKSDKSKLCILWQLREYVDDTEDYINIMLDDKQNHLLQMGVVLTTATVVVSAFVALTGVFGMNIAIELFDETKAGMVDFLGTVGGGTISCVVCFVVAIWWCKYKRLLE